MSRKCGIVAQVMQNTRRPPLGMKPFQKQSVFSDDRIKRTQGTYPRSCGASLVQTSDAVVASNPPPPADTTFRAVLLLRQLVDRVPS
ncbi:MAG: hypothetical protein HY868_12885 [Chloroflexi bacterium]|nr:hypothetical protein [Chloroflexota bacterium]